MNNRSPDPASDAPLQRRSTLSSLMDGDLPPGELTAALAAFRDHEQARADWHAYHLIGDVLRSDELAAPAGRDERFLQGLRQRLALEPAPAAATPWLTLSADAPPAAVNPAAAPRRRTGWWAAPAAVAAGFVVVAGVLVVTRMAGPVAPDAPVIAKAPAAPGTLVRDARLDRYLAAHRSLGNGLASAGGAEHTVQIVFEPK